MKVLKCLTFKIDSNQTTVRLYPTTAMAHRGLDDAPQSSYHIERRLFCCCHRNILSGKKSRQKSCSSCLQILIRSSTRLFSIFNFIFCFFYIQLQVSLNSHFGIKKKTQKKTKHIRENSAGISSLADWLLLRCEEVKPWQLSELQPSSISILHLQPFPPDFPTSRPV